MRFAVNELFDHKLSAIPGFCLYAAPRKMLRSYHEPLEILYANEAVRGIRGLTGYSRSPSRVWGDRQLDPVGRGSGLNVIGFAFS